MLRLENLCMPMGEVVLRAGWSVPPGRRVAILGASGAGKSTLLETIAGFRPPQAGRLLWQDMDMTACAPEARPVAMLFQDNNLFPHLSLARNLGLVLRPDGRLPDPALQARIEDALDRVGLSGLSARKPGLLSGGQQGRAALARVLLQARPVLLLDEPFAALDPGLKAGMLDLVGEVADGVGALVLMVSHDPRDAENWADDVVLVASGKAQPPVPQQAFFANPPDAYRVFLGKA